jgi:hypothetical protein
MGEMSTREKFLRPPKRGMSVGDGYPRGRKLDDGKRKGSCSSVLKRSLHVGFFPAFNTLLSEIRIAVE